MTSKGAVRQNGRLS